MSEYEQKESARERLSHVLTSPELISLTTRRDRQLTLEHLRSETPGLYNQLAGQDHFHEVVESLGWPDETDTFEHTQRDYRSLEDFKLHLTSMNSRFGYPDRGLNNFYHPLIVEPLDPEKEYELNDILHVAEDLRPHIVRAETIAPELIGSLREILKEAYEASKKKGDWPPRVHQAYEDPRVLEGMYRAYQLMGRLVKADDETRQAQMMERLLKLREGLPLPLVKDVHRMLAQ